MTHTVQSPLTQPLPAQSPALEVRELRLSFRERRNTLPVLDGVSLAVAKGEFVSIIGPSGCGKSTLFHVIGGLLKPDAGSVIAGGAEVTGQRGLISYVPQKPALFPWRTTLDNVLLAREISGGAGKEALAEAKEWLVKAGLGGFEKAYPHMLSGGMQQRAAFLRGLLAPQEVMCLDEPFSSLDELTRTEMQHWLLDLWEARRRSVILITHSIEEALMMSDTIYLLSNRPTRVIHRIEVPFPRPRREELTEDTAFLRLKKEIGMQMREEQRKRPN
ncbi:ABC transporter ATP-binding protein [Paenibacillus sp. alder61]|uniref:ABC transporter ATP-binding protein n=1 Tax=Paenibacillus sp. alder61 TaxID=2862948 RepID=UPI001CD7CBCA|nr:ABC transporter ATP-binding protein [Paenibacillus sp. alder61]MCA1292471.1 ABC transporter ATP-binding protein [Paenibacillus sp. alder61]